MTPNEYPVATLEQMAEIPLDRLKAFLDELPAMIAQIKMMKAVEMVTGAKVDIQTPIWIDDDKYEGALTLTDGQDYNQRFVFDTRTGEPKEPTE